MCTGEDGKGGGKRAFRGQLCYLRDGNFDQDKAAQTEEDRRRQKKSQQVLVAPEIGLLPLAAD